ncbi:MAG: AAA family ATPase [Bacteroidota bacterium]
MITEVHIQNYRSIVDQRVKLHPFTLLVGQNGAGKSNFLRCFQILDIGSSAETAHEMYRHKHVNLSKSEQRIAFSPAKAEEVELLVKDGGHYIYHRRHDVLTIRSSQNYADFESAQVFQIDTDKIGALGSVVPTPKVDSDGSGAVEVLDALKTGDREDLFDEIERLFSSLIPEAKKISFVPTVGGKRLQVREKHIDKPILLSELSEGTRLVLTILTILHQENAPQVIGLEDIDRGLHPRLYEQVIQLCRRITEEKDVQIIATTHNPYLVDQFKDHEEAVLIVEKTNGETTFTPLSERIAKFKDVDDADMPLGQMWYQGLVGGVPKLAY